LNQMFRLFKDWMLIATKQENVGGGEKKWWGWIGGFTHLQIEEEDVMGEGIDRTELERSKTTDGLPQENQGQEKTRKKKQSLSSR